MLTSYDKLSRNSRARGWPWRGQWPRLTLPAPPLAGPCPGIFLAAPPLAGPLPWLNFRDPGPGRAFAPAELWRPAPGGAFAPAKYSGPGPGGAKTPAAPAYQNYVLKRRYSSFYLTEQMKNAREANCGFFLDGKYFSNPFCFKFSRVV